MDLNRTPQQIAGAAAEEIRALNHRTIDDPGAFTTPADVSDTATAITSLVQRLPQTLKQLEDGLEHLHDSKQIRLANRDPREVSAKDISDAVSGAEFELRKAATALGRAEEHLRAAASVLTNLGAPWPDSE